MITFCNPHKFATASITLVVLLVLFSSILPARAQTSGQSTIIGIPAGLQDYERWFGSQHSHTHMEGDDGATGSTAAQTFAYAKNIPLLKYFMIPPHPGGFSPLPSGLPSPTSARKSACTRNMGGFIRLSVSESVDEIRFHPRVR